MSKTPGIDSDAVLSEYRHEPPDEEEQSPGRRMDPELLVMGRMLRLLEELEEPAKGRVVRYLASRYNAEALAKIVKGLE